MINLGKGKSHPKGKSKTHPKTPTKAQIGSTGIALLFL
jgi:hypothetical protein